MRTSSIVPPSAQRSRDIMDNPACRLLCIDLQVDAVPGCEPAPSSIFGANQLLTVGRRLGWNIAHARRRTQVVIRSRNGAQAGLNPLMTEQVFFHDDRSIAGSHGLTDLLQSWRGETVFVAAFDHVALLSCLLACYEQGPRLVLIEDVPPLQTLTDPAAKADFKGAATRLAAGSTTIGGIIKESSRRLGIKALSGSVGQASPGVRL
jgi:hypothetical protein